MFRNDLFQDEGFTQKLLDIYSELTNLSVVLYETSSGEVIYSKKNWPKFCQEICRIGELEKKCIMDYKTKKGKYQCYAGLWCYAQPVKVDENIFCTFVVGHRRIKGRVDDSEKVLEQTLFDHNINGEDHDRLMALLKEVDIVDKTAFDIKLFKKLSFIEKFVIREHRNVIMFKKEATSLAHEFLLPIQSIIADAENLFNEAEEGSEFKSTAEDVLQQVTKLYYIAENIRGGSILENRDKFGYEFHDVDIYPIIIDTIKLFRKEAKRKDVVIRDPVAKYTSSFIEMSEPHIRRVFFNLIQNAVKYSYTSIIERSKRYIEVVCNTDRKFYRVEISNYGVGIKREEIEKGLIFESGYRGILARDRSRTGSGVGLATVNEIVEAHSGRIKVESVQVGNNPISGPYKTTVKICIPFRQSRSDPHGKKSNIMDRR